MDLRLETTAELHKLGSIAHQLAQLPQRRRRDPRLRQPVQPQHVRKVRRVVHIVLHAAITPVQRAWVRKMHPRAKVLEQVDRPIPAIRRLDHDLGSIAAQRDHLRELERTVHDPMQPKPLTTRRQAHDHRTATMKVDPDILSIHRGLPSSEEELVCGSPESPTGTRNLHGERRPRPFIASDMAEANLPADRNGSYSEATSWSVKCARL